MSEKPRWNGGFEEASRIAWEILNDYAEPEEQAPKIAEALVEAFDNGVYAECCARDANLLEESDPEIKRQIFTKLLREHGIGILSLEELQAITLAVAREELKLPPDEPKLSFSSIEAMVACLKRAYKKEETEDLCNH